jgi:hypothetical protein
VNASSCFLNSGSAHNYNTNPRHWMDLQTIPMRLVNQQACPPWYLNNNANAMQSLS